MSTARLVIKHLALLLGAVFILDGCLVRSGEPYRGMYAFGPEVEVFSPCGSDKVYWLIEAPDLEALKLQLARSGQLEGEGPFPSIYIEFNGYKSEEAADGFSGAYDGLIQLDSLSLHQLKPPPACQSGF